MSPSPLDNPAFRRWFGDSKVVDENGEPLVVYHGTSASFDVFDSSRYGEASDAGTLGAGFYFTSLRAAAESYAQAAAEKSGGIPRVVEAYLRIERPYVAPRRIWNLSHDLPAARKHTANLRRQGHDGVAFRIDLSVLGDPVFMEYVVFSPTQIKSATDNVGTYDPSDPSILRNRAAPRCNPDLGSRRPLDNPNFRRWFGDSKVVDENGEPLVLWHGGYDVVRHPPHVLQAGTHGRLGPGIYLTPTRMLAAEYARSPGEALAALYARVENPLLVHFADDDPISDALFRATGVRTPFASNDRRYHKHYGDDVRHAVLSAGFDGIFATDHMYGMLPEARCLSKLRVFVREIVVFDSQQVKSATDNVGTYDPSDPSILRNRAAPRRNPGPHIDDLCATTEGLFHATSFANLAGIAEHGLVPRSGGGLFQHGGYDRHSQGKVFLACGKDAALAWFGKVEDQLHYHFQDEEEPDALVPVLLMVSSSHEFGEVFLDPIGDRDVPGSLYVEERIPPDSLFMWSPSEQEWIMVEDWESEDPYAGVQSIEHYNDEGDVVDEDEGWESRSFQVYGPYDRGGFKPDRDDDDAWEPI